MTCPRSLRQHVANSHDIIASHAIFGVILKAPPPGGMVLRLANMRPVSDRYDGDFHSVDSCLVRIRLRVSSSFHTGHQVETTYEHC